MQNVTTAYTSAINATVRRNKAKVELYSGSTLAATFTESDKIVKLDISRTAESGKFFGQCITQKLSLELIDYERDLEEITNEKIKVYLGVVLANGTVEYKSFPDFYISEVHRDEKTYSISITAYDKIKAAEEMKVSELELSAPYTVADIADAAADYLGLSSVVEKYIPEEDTCFLTELENGGNFEGTEDLRSVITAIAEVTQTTAYIDYENNLVFKRIFNVPPVDRLQINKTRYSDFESGDNRRLANICRVTELGDNITVFSNFSGSTQYIRNNPIYDALPDETVTELLEQAIAQVGLETIAIFDIEWRGNPALEIGDRLTIISTDNTKFVSYLLDDTLSFDGGLHENSIFEYDDEAEEESNPSNLGEAIKQTYAKVDKANKEISLVASEASTTSNKVTTLTETVDSINASVMKVQTNTEEKLQGLSDDIGELAETVNLKMTSEEVKIEIQKELDNGVTKINTGTGFTFDESGLTIDKVGSEMQTNINEDGMTIRKEGNDSLIVDNTGVKAINLTASQYLLIGTRSRIEDYETDRTGCFWIGG